MQDGISIFAAAALGGPLDRARIFSASLTFGLLAACGGGGAPPDAPAQPAGGDAANPGVVPMAGGGNGESTAKSVNAGEPVKNPLLDDGEDGDNKCVADEKRGGYWYTYADKVGTTIEPAGTFKMSEGGANNSKWAARMHGKLGPGGILYAGMGFSFTEPKGAYDVSSCKGISFWGKKAGTGASKVRVKLGDAYTAPEGGACKECYNDFGAEYTFTDAWQEFTLNFADMKQEAGWGEQRPQIDPTRVYQPQWQVNQPPGAEFDIWVDDIKLVGCGG